MDHSWSTDFNKVLEFKAVMLEIARASISYGLKNRSPLTVIASDFDNCLRQKGSCFVTLTKNGHLRGCVGSLGFSLPLIEDIAHNAYSAAFLDDRFSPLASGELEDINIEISLLTPLQEIKFRDEQDLKSQITPGTDGLVLEDKFRGATFIPAVWEQIENVDEFLSHLKMKMGCSPDYWSDSIKASKFQALKIRD